MADDLFYTSQISLFGCDYAIADWSFCNGAQLPIAQNPALYSLLGIAFGGDGRMSFNLPDLVGRMPLGTGMDHGTSTRIYRGDKGGQSTVALDVANLATHSHQAVFTPHGNDGPTTVMVTAFASGAETETPNDGALIAGGDSMRFRYPGGSNQPAQVALGGVTVTGGDNYGGSVDVDTTGTGTPFSVQNPYLGLGYQICLSGIYPTRE